MGSRNFCVALVLGLICVSDTFGAEKPKRTEAEELWVRGSNHEREKRYAYAIVYYTRAIEKDPTFISAYYNRAAIYTGHPEFAKRDNARAAADYSTILEIEPNRCEARYNRALCYEALGKADESIADYTRVITGPTDFSNVISRDQVLAMAHHYRGRMYHWYKKDYRKATADYTEALRMDPKIENAHHLRGQTYHLIKEYAKARADFSIAMKEAPDHINLLVSATWLYATCPDASVRDGRQALELTKRIEKRGGTDLQSLDAMAAAYAENGDFAKAIELQQKAVDRLKPKIPEHLKELPVRLALYKTHKPYRTE